MAEQPDTHPPIHFETGRLLARIMPAGVADVDATIRRLTERAERAEAGLAQARAAYVALLHTYHEENPDHCGGECFKSALIDSALGMSSPTEPISQP